MFLNLSRYTFTREVECRATVDKRCILIHASISSSVSLKETIKVLKEKVPNFFEYVSIEKSFELAKNTWVST